MYRHESLAYCGLPADQALLLVPLPSLHHEVVNGGRPDLEAALDSLESEDLTEWDFSVETGPSVRLKTIPSLLSSSSLLLLTLNMVRHWLSSRQ